MKKFFSLFLTIILIIQLCCVTSVFANAVSDDFTDTVSWSINIPDIYENESESYAHLKHTSALKSFTQYKFTPPANDVSGKFVVETRVKNPSASMSLMTVYLKNMTSAPAVQIRSQYTGLNDGYSWRNLKVDKPVSRIKTDIIPEKADFTSGWDTIYMVFDALSGIVDVYFNGPDVKYTSEISTESGGLDYILFGVRRDIETEADAGIFIDYVSIYPYEDAFTPPSLELNEKFIDEDFERYDIDDNAFKGFIGYGPATTDYSAKVALDPVNSENKCLKLENTTATTKNIAQDLDYENLHFEFKAYMPDNVYTQFPKFRSGSKEVVYGSTDTQGKYNISGGGGSVEFNRNGWNSFVFDFDGTNAEIKINENDKIIIPCDAQKIDCVLFSLWENMAPLYIDDLLIYENNGQPVIRASKKGGTVKYGSKIYLYSNVNTDKIYYTLDGTDPDMSTSNVYTDDGIEITDNDVIIKAYGVNGDVAGRVFTFGKYTLESENGIIFIPVEFNENDLLLEADFSFINTQSDSQNVCVILGMYDKDGTLIDSVYEENLSLESGKTTKTLSLNYPENIKKSDITFKAYIWSDMLSYTPLTEAAIYKNGLISYENAPLFAYDTLPSMPVIESYKVNNEEKTITLNGSVENAVKNQDITFAVFDKNNRLIVLEQKYVNDNREFTINSKFDALNASGGPLKAYVGSRQNLSALYLDKGYYVDDLENKNLTSLLNNETSSSALIDRMRNYSLLNIIPIDFDNHKLYNENKALCEVILFNSKNQNNFKSLSDAKNSFEKACVSAKVSNSSDKKYFDEILKNSEILNYPSEENYKISLIEDFDKYNDLFGFLLSKENLSLLTNEKIEQIYKTSYALCKINSAEKSEIIDILETYNEEIFKLDMEEDYKKVSAYEVAKALYNKNFETTQDLKTAFNERVEYLINNTSSSSGTGGSSSAGGGSSNRVTVNTPVNILPDDKAYENETQIFKDVKKEHWAFSDIGKLYNKKIISGYGDDTFMPDGSVTRAEFLKMAVAAFDLKNNGEKVLFKDVSENEWFNDFINIAAQNGLVVGFDGYIRPYDSITRQETAMIIVRALNIENDDVVNTSFDDDNMISDYAKPAVYYLSKNGFIKGYNDNTFMPLKNLTRAEAAKILCSVLGL